MGHILANTWKFDQISPMVMLYFSILTVPKSYPERQSFRLEPSKCHNFALLTFPAFCSGEQTQRHDVKVWLYSFIQITVFCPPEP